MSDRYTRLYSLPENLYAEGMPVVISAGVLWKDNQSGKILAQLKIKNISTKTIKAAKIKIIPFNTVGEGIDGVTEYPYLDLTANRDKEFGQKVMIPLPNKETRKFEVEFVSIGFEDNTVWNGEAGKIKTLEKPVTLLEKLQDSELVKQYKINYGTYGEYYPTEVDDLWYCTCGALNRREEDACHKCDKKFSELKSIDLDALSVEKDARLAEVAEKAEADRLEAERKAEERRIAAEKAAKKRVKIIAVVAPIIVACVAFLIVLTTVIIPKQKMNKAIALLNNGEYDKAYALFEEMGDTDAITSSKYDRAVELMDSGEYVSAIALFKTLGDYKDSIDRIHNCETKQAEKEKENEYNTAIALINEGKFVDAYERLVALDGFKDSTEKMQEIKPQYQQILLGKARVRDTVYFGSYEQDNNTSNGKEDIEWIVLAKENGKALVISKYVLDCKKYNSSDTAITWEKCSLRTWLNGTFLNDAFSTDEQAKIAKTTVSADKNPESWIDPGNATTDKVFLLSIMEVEKYFASANARCCKPTKYAVARGDADNSGEYWWLRSPGISHYNATLVFVDGTVGYGGGNYDAGVRPAIWISLD